MTLFKNKVKLKANAKININLYVGEKRADGYHELDGIMQSVSLCDTITVKKAKKTVLKCSKPYLSGEDNLGFKAATLFFNETKINGGAHIYINKKIPEAAGLGGGSADAAAVLLALNKLYHTDLKTKKLEKMAAVLGADVPFFIRGGTMRAKGIGEILEELPPLKKGYFVIAKAGQKPSTKEMYRQLDSCEHTLIDVNQSVEYIKNNDFKGLNSLLLNSFNEVYPDKTLENRLKEFSPLGVGLSGSGPTYFAAFETKADAKKCLKALKRENLLCFLACPLEKGIIFKN